MLSKKWVSSSFAMRPKYMFWTTIYMSLKGGGSIFLQLNMPRGALPTYCVYFLNGKWNIVIQSQLLMDLFYFSQNNHFENDQKMAFPNEVKNLFSIIS